MIQELVKGGLKMIDVKSFIDAQQLIWIDKITPENTQVWYQALKYYLNRFGGIFLFNCNFEFNDTYRDMPEFYSLLLQRWISLSTIMERQPSRSQIIWNNCNIKIDKNMVFYKKMFDKGIYFMHQIILRKEIVNITIC